MLAFVLLSYYRFFLAFFFATGNLLLRIRTERHYARSRRCARDRTPFSSPAHGCPLMNRTARIAPDARVRWVDAMRHRSAVLLLRAK